MIRLIEKSNREKIDIEKEFHRLNDLVFDGELNLTFPLLWKKLKTVVGKVEYSYYGDKRNPESVEIEELSLSTLLDLPKDEIINVLIHEMIHVYFLQKGRIEEHSSNFMNMMKRINKSFPQFNVKRSENASYYSVEKSSVRKKNQYFLIFHFTKGPTQYGIMPFSKLQEGEKNIEESLYNALERFRLRRHEVEMIEYGESDEILLQKYRTSKNIVTGLRNGNVFDMSEKEYETLKPYVQGERGL